MNKIAFALLFILTLSVTSHAQTITLPALPKSSLALFRTTEPTSFEVQTASTTGNAMTYWQGTVSINAVGDITGQAGIGAFANSDKAVNSTVTNTSLSGKIFNPRVAWSNEEVGTEDGVTYKYRSADYVADLFVKTNTANFIIKGALVYRLRISYYYDTKTKKTSIGDDYSYVDVRACAFGPNGQLGYVMNGPN